MSGCLTGSPLLTPSSSSMISMPMEARVVHLQLFVALTAQRLCALNLQTASSEEQGRSPQYSHPWSQTPLHLCSGQHPAPLLLWPSLERLPCPPPSRTQH